MARLDEPRESVWRRIRRWLARLFAVEEVPGREPVWPSSVGVDLDDEEDVARAGVEVDRQLEEEFRRSLREPVRVVQIRMERVDFFGDTTWDLHPSVNVLLGRNGYGKSLVLRTLAGMLQRDRQVTGDLFRGVGASGGTIELRLARGAHTKEIRRDHEVFLRGSASRVPLLAIPDARFVDRSDMVVSQPSALDLAYEGARHFLEQLPYQAAVEGFLMGLCTEYWRNGRSFRSGTFEFLDTTMTELTGRGVGFDHIEDIGRTGGIIWVRTDGLDRPIEIQRASQGTLSVLAMFGLIHQFLEDIGRAAGTGSRSEEAIVLIDEVDAHLHPEWQRRIRKLLTDTFPSVQFVLTAHSPLVVAGCGPREVAVLRRPEAHAPFRIEEHLDDFVGATPAQLYAEVFRIEERDEVFLEAATTKARGQDAVLKRRLDELVAKRGRKALSAEEEREYQDLARDVSRIVRVDELEEREQEKDERIADLEAEVARLEGQLSAQQRAVS
jgi:predicted ATPase